MTFTDADYLAEQARLLKAIRQEKALRTGKVAHLEKQLRDLTTAKLRQEIVRGRTGRAA